MVVYMYDFDGRFFKNPIAKFCLDNLKKQLSDTEIKIFNESDLPIKECNHSMIAESYPRKLDQLRMRMAMDCKEDCLTLDGDVFIPDVKEILKYKNTVFADARLTEKPYINNSVFMFTSKRNEWVRYYNDLYNTRPEELKDKSNIQVFDEYPHKGIRMNTNTNCLHWGMSKFETFYKRYPNVKTIYYTYKPDEINDKVYWRLSNCDVPIKYLDFADGGSVFFFETLFPGLKQEEAFDLWKQQLYYTYQRDIKFEEI